MAILAADDERVDAGIGKIEHVEEYRRTKSETYKQDLPSLKTMELRCRAHPDFDTNLPAPPVGRASVAASAERREPRMRVGKTGRQA